MAVVEVTEEDGEDGPNGDGKKKTKWCHLPVWYDTICHTINRPFARKLSFVYVTQKRSF